MPCSRWYRGVKKLKVAIHQSEIFGTKCGGLKCSKCGYNRCFAALDLHHLDPALKEFNFKTKLMLKPTEERVKELDKCILLCSNCHRELHNGGLP